MAGVAAPGYVMEQLETDDLIDIVWAVLEGGDPIAATYAALDSRGVPTATLIINMSDSKCSACKKGTIPNAEYHDELYGYSVRPNADGERPPGCGALFIDVASDYIGGNMLEKLRELRPDLPIAPEYLVLKPGALRCTSCGNMELDLLRVYSTNLDTVKYSGLRRDGTRFYVDGSGKSVHYEGSDIPDTFECVKCGAFDMDMEGIDYEFE